MIDHVIKGSSVMYLPGKKFPNSDHVYHGYVLHSNMFQGEVGKYRYTVLWQDGVTSTHHPDKLLNLATNKSFDDRLRIEVPV